MNVCAVNQPSLLKPLVQDGFPAGRSYKGEFVQAMRCPHCSYVRFPAPPDELLAEYYAEEYPKSSLSWYNVDTDYSEWKVTSRSGRIVELLNRFGYGQFKSLHEFGCAFGGTVHGLRQRGYDATGTELNAVAVNSGRQRGNDSIYAEDTLSYLARTGERPDAVYSWHAIEHFTNPVGFLKELKKSLRHAGLLILIAPSSAARFSLVYGHSRYVWFGYPEHLHLFSPGSAPALAEAIGMSLVHVSTVEYGIEPEATKAALLHESDAAQWLRQGDVELLGEELVMVFRNASYPPSESERRMLLKCEMAAAVERRAMDALESKAVDPWAKATT